MLAPFCLIVYITAFLFGEKVLDDVTYVQDR